MPFLAGSAQAVGDASGSSIVFTRPSGLVTDDNIRIWAYVESTTLSPTISPGTWVKDTAAGGEQLNDGGGDFEIHVWNNRFAGETGNITVTLGGTTWRTGLLGVYTDRINTGSVLDATSTWNPVASAGTALVALAVTTGNADADIVASGHNIGGRTHTWSVLTERADFGGQSFADVLQAAAGASGNKTATISSDQHWGASLAALRKSGAAPADKTPYVLIPTFGPIWAQ